MVDKRKAKAIWTALEAGKVALLELGPVRMSTTQIVDFIVKKVEAELAPKTPTDPSYTRGEIVEAWLYQSLQQYAEVQGVEPLPPRAPN